MMSEHRRDLRRALDAGVPYFGPALCADQGHHRFEYFPRIVDVVREATGRKFLHILEIGSWAGASLVAWATACGSECRLVAIDDWQPYIGTANNHHAEMTRAAETGEILDLFRHNIRAAKIEHLVSILRGRAEERLPECAVESFDIVFIDGDHFYEHVRHDITKSMPLVRNGGILCGDDLEKQHREVFDLESYKSPKQEFVRFEDGSGYHPGVTRAVHEIFGRVSCWNGLWLMQRIDGRWESRE